MTGRPACVSSWSGRRILGLVIAWCLAVPSLAAAHAELQISAPSDGAVVSAGPSTVTLTFTEPVEAALGAVKVFDGDTRQVGDGSITRSGSRVVGTRLPANLANGTYTVSWRVLSADGHPLDGAFVFHVGAPGTAPAGVADKVGGGPSTAIIRAGDITRFLNVLLVVLLLGALFTTVVVIGPRDEQVAANMWYVVAGLGFATSIVAAATVVVQSAIVTGSGLGDATQGSVISAVLDTRFGKVRLAEVILAELLAIGAVWAPSGAMRRWIAPVLMGLGVALAATLGLSGHAGARGPLAVIADMGHVLAASAWVGGLVALMVALWMAKDRRTELARATLPRFSTIALVSVGVLIVAGTIGTITHIRGISDLWQTDYGRLIVAKIALAGVLIGLGFVNRRRVAALAAGRDPSRQVGLLRRMVGGELVVMAAAVVVASALIAKPPADVARAGVAAPPVTATGRAGDIAVRVLVTPGRTGSNVVTVELARAGTPVDVQQVDVALRPASGDLGRFRGEAARTATGRYASAPVQLTRPGVWIVDVDLRRSDFELIGASVRLPIGTASGG